MWLGGAFESLPKHGTVPTKRELTARIGPPAMMPVPLGAGLIITLAAPW
jgi:hypothetical protein